MSDPMIKVDGIGELLPHFFWKTENIDLRTRKTSNGHNEGRVDVYCEEEYGINDVVQIAGYKTTGGYHMELAVDSEVKVPLWYDGRLFFDYSEKTGHWTMHGITEKGFWAFCDPKATVNVVISALECLSVPFKPAEKEWLFLYQMKVTLNNLSNSLNNEISNPQPDEANLINTAWKYLKNADCTFTPPNYEVSDIEGYGQIIF